MIPGIKVETADAYMARIQGRIADEMAEQIGKSLTDRLDIKPWPPKEEAKAKKVLVCAHCGGAFGELRWSSVTGVGGLFHADCVTARLLELDKVWLQEEARKKETTYNLDALSDGLRAVSKPTPPRMATGVAAAMIDAIGALKARDEQLAGPTFRDIYTKLNEPLTGCVPIEYEKPDLPTRYAAFRETVERIVREEAPNAKVVTDVTRGRDARLLYDIRLGTETLSGSRLADEWPNAGDPNQQWLRADIAAALRRLGARAMGAK